MCVIVYKPLEAPLPKEPLLRICWKRNPDGAGLMWPENGTLHFIKGRMTWESFLEAWRSLSGRQDMEQIPIAIHFRVSTSGKVDSQQCHPFPIGAASASLALKGRAEAAFMHNGELSQMDAAEGESDTMAFMRSIVRPLCCCNHNCLSDKQALRSIDEGREESRFLMMDGRGRTRLFGDWIYDSGLLFSKRSYQPKRRLPAAVTQPA